MKENVSDVSEPDPVIRQPADFETAIKCSKFGKFNILLLVLTFPASCVPIFETTTMSYVFPVAQCDLNLTLTDKGYLNAYSFMGMITSGYLWGFLIDILGRRKILLVGYMANGMVVLASGFSPNYACLVVMKFLGGFIATGPFSAMTVYVSEFHRSAHRARIQLMRGIMINSGLLLLALIAWGILPMEIHIYIGYNLHAWNVFLWLSSVPCLISIVVFVFMPESPKFLMTVGRNDEALKIFRLIFSINTGKSKDLYPISELIDETKMDRRGSNIHGGHVTANRSKKQAFKEGCNQVRPICFPPFLKLIILVCCLQSCYMLSLNTLRLWMPQIFQAIYEYKHYNNGSSSDLCTMLLMIRKRYVSKYSNETCTVNKSYEVYTNALIIAAVSILLFLLAFALVNLTGKKVILGTFPIVAGGCSASIYFAPDVITTLALISVFIALGSVCIQCTLVVVIDLFPTTLRAVSISLVMTSARLATIIGNLVFPKLLNLGCAPPFMTLAVINMIPCVLVLFLPNLESPPTE